jgi:EAL domain-containing protein (putative c-di-GMP-specific phosphodiesterase class I)
MRRTETALANLEALSRLGIQIAIDDFGTGYSSLSYLSKLPVRKLKVDKQFIRDVLTDDNDAALAASIIAMGGALGLDVVAEGVETQSQAEFLRRHGCRLGQGYLFSRPLPAADIERYLQAELR